jgi:hypothetical protein
LTPRRNVTLVPGTDQHDPQLSVDVSEIEAARVTGSQSGQREVRQPVAFRRKDPGRRLGDGIRADRYFFCP